ncbi:histidine kinase [Streptomyces sp. DSM 42041]|uniref:histidine kinase n=1 Tax=Streptomyces hazeniae TaxID=3075538 RepID=A0ABU2NV25_9ACTN|nr:histidine kinase [Streptomyces sp. DSM 42041]MDT0380832.1 histidine kinase [Streptomyces sp. DSM 42041]
MPSLPLPRRPARPHRDDVLIGAAGLAGGLALWGAGIQGGPELLGVPSWAALVALAVMAGTELLRRSAPGVALVLGTAALALDTLAGTLVAPVVMFTDLVYAAVVYGGPKLARRLPRATVPLTVLATVVPVSVWRNPELLLIGMATGLITLAPSFTGVVVRGHREAAEAERLRAEQTLLLAEADRVQAVNAERARMARELHDIVANHLSAIAIHATAAQALQHDRDATRDALGVIRENSVQGLTEMRRLIGILRDAEGRPVPDATPRLDGLDALLARARAAGGTDLVFSLHDARRAGDGPPVPVEMAAYRVVQEAVTNALKHASPGEVAVRLADVGGGGGSGADGDGGGLAVTVTSPLGGGRPSGPRAPGSGAGLVGMRERVELLGGTLTAGPASPEGDGRRVWRVRAELPAEGRKKR